jgi:ferric-dicitrate binding protein FerR (iron transport regulator)
MTGESERGVLRPEEQERRRRSRSIAIALALAAMAVLFFITTIVRLGGNVADRTF